MQDKPIYRVDKFRVPRESWPEFLERVRQTHQMLRTLPGFVEDSVLEQTGGPGRFNLITVVAWENAEAMEAARKTVAAMQQEAGFKPAEVIERLGVEADIGTYKSLGV